MFFNRYFVRSTPAQSISSISSISVQFSAIQSGPIHSVRSSSVQFIPVQSSPIQSSLVKSNLPSSSRIQFSRVEFRSVQSSLLIPFTHFHEHSVSWQLLFPFWGKIPSRSMPTLYKKGCGWSLTTRMERLEPDRVQCDHSYIFGNLYLSLSFSIVLCFFLK